MTISTKSQQLDPSRLVTCRECRAGVDKHHSLFSFVGGSVCAVDCAEFRRERRWERPPLLRTPLLEPR